MPGTGKSLAAIAAGKERSIASPGPLWTRGVYACGGACGRTVPDFDADGGRFCAFLKAVPWARRAGMAPAGQGSCWLRPGKAQRVFRGRSASRGSRGKRRHSPRRGALDLGSSAGSYAVVRVLGKYVGDTGARRARTAGSRAARATLRRAGACFEPCRPRAVSWTFSCAAYARGQA